MSITSPQYWRGRKVWSAWLGRKGTVVVSTLIHVGSPAFSENTPYPYVIVDFGDEQHSFIGVGHEEFLPGETVECVWRKFGSGEAHEVIEYGIKVQRYTAEGEAAFSFESEFVDQSVEEEQTQPAESEYVPLHR